MYFKSRVVVLMSPILVVEASAYLPNVNGICSAGPNRSNLSILICLENFSLPWIGNQTEPTSRQILWIVFLQSRNEEKEAQLQQHINRPLIHGTS